MKDLHLFSNVQIAEDAYIITENYDQGHRYTIGLIRGTDRAMVIDAGLGMAGNLRQYIEGMIGTDLPVFAVFTHGHSDVLGGSAAFDEVYLNAEDQRKYPESTDMEQRTKQMGFFSARNPEIIEYGKAHALDNSSQIFHDLKDGDHFDLGGASADILAIPGHTPGSVLVRVTLHDGSHISFCGDAFSAGMNHFMTMNGQELSDYGIRLNALLKKLDKNEDVYCTHAAMPLKPAFGMTIARACIEAAEGSAEYDPMYMNPFARDGQKENIKTHYCGNNFIVYDADRM